MFKDAGSPVRAVLLESGIGPLLGPDSPEVSGHPAFGSISQSVVLGPFRTAVGEAMNAQSPGRH